MTWVHRRWALLALVAVIGAWTAYFSWITLQVHHGLGTSSYDLGLYDQGVWLMSRFRSPFVTLMGRNLMGDHASLILVFLVPLYWVWPSVGVLLGTQSLVIALGCVPVFLLARERLRSEAAALALACLYLLHPAVGWTNREGFHPDSFLGLFVGMAIYGALQRRWRVYVVFVVLSLLVKEDVSLVIVPLGVWVALRRDRRVGLLTVAGSLLYMLAATYGLMRSLIGVPTRNGWRIPFGGPWGLVSETFTRPANVVRYLRSEGRPFYLWQMTAPVALAVVRSPAVAAISGLVLLSNVVSTFTYQHLVQYHYSMVAVPALVLAAVCAIERLVERAGDRWRRPVCRLAVGAVTVAAVVCAWMWSVVPIARLACGSVGWSGVSCQSWGRPFPAYWAPDYAPAAAGRELIRLVPPDAVVSAQHSLTPHLTHRRFVYMFPNPFRAVLYGVDDTLERDRVRLPMADQVQYVLLPVDRDARMTADWDAVSARFELVTANQYWELYRRR